VPCSLDVYSLPQGSRRMAEAPDPSADPLAHSLIGQRWSSPTRRCRSRRGWGWCWQQAHLSTGHRPVEVCQHVMWGSRPCRARRRDQGRQHRRRRGHRLGSSRQHAAPERTRTTPPQRPGQSGPVAHCRHRDIRQASHRVSGCAAFSSDPPAFLQRHRVGCAQAARSITPRDPPGDADRA
jgi:hypothetical protein